MPRTSDAQEQHGYAEVHERGRQPDRQAKTRLIERLRVHEPIERGYAYAGGRHEDERAFDPAGKIFRLAMAERMVFIGWPLGDGQHGERHHPPDQVDDRFERIREQSDRSCDIPRPCLEDDRNKCRRNGNPRESGERRLCHKLDFWFVHEEPEAVDADDDGAALVAYHAHR